MKQPSDFVGNKLQGYFGMIEYEEAIATIVEYLADDIRRLEIHPGFDWSALHELGWKKLFRISDFNSIKAALFAMLCASGWISCNYYPKYTFRLSEGAIQRLHEKAFQEEPRNDVGRS